MSELKNATFRRAVDTARFGVGDVAVCGIHEEEPESYALSASSVKRKIIFEIPDIEVLLAGEFTSPLDTLPQNVVSRLRHSRCWTWNIHATNEKRMCRDWQCAVNVPR